MVFGYRLLEPFWKREDKIRIMKEVNKSEFLVYFFLIRLIWVTSITIPLSTIFYLLIYGSVHKFITILILVLIFTSILCQIYRSWLLFKYEYHKRRLGKILILFSLILVGWGFTKAIMGVSEFIPLTLLNTYLQFINHIVFLLLISSISFKLFKNSRK